MAKKSKNKIAYQLPLKAQMKYLKNKNPNFQLVPLTEHSSGKTLKQTFWITLKVWGFFVGAESLINYTEFCIVSMNKSHILRLIIIRTPSLC